MIEPKYFIEFNGDGNTIRSKGINGVLKVGIGDYILNPTEEDYRNKWLKDHHKITLFDRIKSIINPSIEGKGR